MGENVSTHSRTGCGDLLLEASLGTVELQEQSRGHRVGQRAEPVARVHHHIVQKLCMVNTEHRCQCNVMNITADKKLVRLTFM